MAFFMTKKQKAQMRERRRKKQKLGGSDMTEEQGQAQGEENSKKRKLDNQDVDENQNESSSSLIVVIPANSKAKDAKKIRKDARRKARSEGKDENSIKFVIEGQENDEPKKIEASASKRPKTHKKSFPRINDMLEEQKKIEKEQQQVEAKRQAEAKLPEDIKSKYLALDCEMVGIGLEGKQSALARVSLLDWHGEVILDTFVKVPSRVTDFRTHVSGVTAKHLHSDDAMELHACRKKVGEILRNKILVGHALKNDLQALLLDHPKDDIRDTAKYRPFQRASGRNGGKWRPRKLRDLVKENLNIDIQVAGQAHDSTEDARASMDLFKHVREVW
eukprot:CAMPEP_0195281702 /NCGR_PEP_ID=MMETSP0707-20130614/904_1 /TAXON_ID=33640 /ORGANISM="Asterionellopsis glacialis, Strain CCMP134" /LENGTH=331 /DNA_ID=CAMNT_0040340613 /DNA_START=46 /DNA_END=1038 /DNA_ORIENTATION=-